MKKLSMEELNRKSVEEFKQSDKMPIIAVLENIRSAYNVGSVFRTADAFLLEGIYICGYTAYPPHKEIKKTALGAEDTVHWKQFKSIKDAIEELKALGYKIFAVEQAKGSIPLQEFNKANEKIAVVFGNFSDSCAWVECIYISIQVTIKSHGSASGKNHAENN